MGVVVKGFVAGGHPQARSRDEDGRLASYRDSQTFTSPPPHSKKFNLLLLPIYNITVWEIGFHHCVHLYETALLKNGQNKLKKYESTGSDSSVPPFLDFVVVLKSSLHKHTSSKTS